MAKKKPLTSDEEMPAPEGYTVLARRYRPQQFTDLVGQEPVAKALTNALKSNRVAHAYLFTGARGVGKTSCARILAKALNCVNGPTPTPCDQCDMCRTIATGEDVDVLEIDAASNRGIDNIRDLRSTVSSRPTARSRYKIYIIDEVHMLTREAFNALLKTLEEPPPHVKFVFATTEVQKIPITILSRCQRFDFAGIGTSRIVDRLREVVAAEGREADDEALEIVARRAGGSMRDAQSLLDQLLAFGNDRLTAEQVHQLLGTAHDDRILELAAAVIQHDGKQALDLLGQAADQGLQLGELLDQVIAYWRDLMIVHCAGSTGMDLSVPPRHREMLVKQAAEIKLDTILAGLDALNTTKARLRGSNHGRTLIEMALVRLSRMDDLVSLTQLSQWLAQGRAVTGSDGTATRPAIPSANAAPATSPLPRQGTPAPSDLLKKNLVTAETPAQTGPITAESLPRVWQGLLAQVGPMCANALQKGAVAISGPNTLVTAFDQRYNHECEYCQSPARVAHIEGILQRITGQKCQFRVESQSGNSQGEPRGNGENPGSEPEQPRPRSRRGEVPPEPLLQRAIEVLEAQLVHVDEGFAAAPAPSGERPEPGDGEET